MRAVLLIAFLLGGAHLIMGQASDADVAAPSEAKAASAEAKAPSAEATAQDQAAPSQPQVAICKGSKPAAQEKVSASKVQTTSKDGLVNVQIEVFNSHDSESNESQKESKEDGDKKAPLRKALNKFSKALGSFENRFANEPEHSFGRMINKEMRKAVDYTSKLVDSVQVDSVEEGEAGNGKGKRVSVRGRYHNVPVADLIDNANPLGVHDLIGLRGPMGLFPSMYINPPMWPQLAAGNIWGPGPFGFPALGWPGLHYGHPGHYLGSGQDGGHRPAIKNVEEEPKKPQEPQKHEEPKKASQEHPDSVPDKMLMAAPAAAPMSSRMALYGL